MAAARRPFFCGNWKLNGSIAESLALATDVRNGVSSLRDVDVAVAPSFTALYAVAKRLEDGPVTVAAQDCFWEEKGAFTGEVSSSQLVDAGCKHVIIGHSERRQLFGELDAAVNLKARAALRAGLSPIICVGETLAERDAGETIGRVQAQLDAALVGIDEASLERVVIAYEPVWAIGTGRNATPAQAQEVHHFIRTRIAASAAPVAPRLRILYGGSMKPDNVRALMAEADVDGGLVGGASLSAESFVRLVKEGSTP
jgi:triosephosphate isomerase